MTQIATDKILSEEEINEKLLAVLFADFASGGEANEIEDSHRQLAALCRAQQKSIKDLRPVAICHAAHYASVLGTELHPVHAKILEQAEELIAVFPETLREK